MANDRFQNKYRIPPARAAWWDYSNSGAYFVTICTKSKSHFFGKISKNQLVTTKIGELAAHHGKRSRYASPTRNLARL